MTLAEKVREKFPAFVTESRMEKGDAVVRVQRNHIKEFLASLKADPELDFSMLIDLFSVDYLHWEEKENRFEVSYNLYSWAKKHRLFVKVELPETDAVIDSATSVWPAADWYEREVWDMMGIVFTGHPQLKRILMYESFEGHPLRKDYPFNRRQPLIGPLN